MEPQPETGSNPEPETGTEHQTEQTAPETGNVEERLAAMAAALKKANAEAAKFRKAAEAADNAEREKASAALSEMDKLKAQLSEAQAHAAELERQHLQRQAADAAKLPAALASRIQGETLEDMEADARELAKLLTSKPAPPPVASTAPGSNGKTGESDAERRRRLLG